MKDQHRILNVHNCVDYSQFDERRVAVLASLKKRNLQQLWFGNLMDVCIGRISGAEGGNLAIDDVESISAALEDVLFRLAKRQQQIIRGELSSTPPAPRGEAEVKPHISPDVERLHLRIIVKLLGEERKA